MLDKLREVESRYRDIETRLADPSVATDPVQLRDLTKELRRLQPVVEAFGRYQALETEIEGARELLEEPDEEVVELAREELAELQARKELLEAELKALLLPRDPDDAKDVVLEIRAAAGGEEAGLFAADLFRMYSRFIEDHGWKLEVLNSHPTPGGGFKEVVLKVAGKEVFSRLKYEGGVHRVQRVPETESQGRIHTSTSTVAVLPVADAVDVAIEPAELRIDVYRSTGPGGQSVNTTDSAVRITHLPTGLVVTCQDEKSQHKNKARAFTVLRARLLDQARAEQAAERGEARRGMVGTGDRSEKVRTYNFPQNRVTDHRIGRSWHRLESILAGDLDDVISEVAAAARAEALKATADAPAAP